MAHVCMCIPEYVPDVRTIINDSDAKACNFYEHATCVAYVYYYYDLGTAQCLPGCIDSAYEPVKMQVIMQGCCTLIPYRDFVLTNSLVSLIEIVGLKK